MRALFALAALVCANVAAAAPAQRALLAEEPPATLSATGLFADREGMVPAAGVAPYSLATPLFSDYALKFRYVYVPTGERAIYRDDGVFDFPVGSVLVKTFAYPKDMRAPESGLRLLETRLLIRGAAGWSAWPYVWDASGKEARLALAGAEFPVEWTHTDGSRRSVLWAVPNKNQCKTCHGRDRDVVPIGPKADNLDFDHPYADGARNQIAEWRARGILGEGAPPSGRAVRFDDSRVDLALRARAYLDVNCAHCHNPHGSASNSGLNLTRAETDRAKLGFGKRPVAAGRGSGGLEFAIEAGAPDRSILLYRMISTDPGVMMPELGRSLAHEEGNALIREWIASEPRR
jgi:uncharacterized repeat protein (TIGR03806 family)